MELNKACRNILSQLTELVNQIKQEDFSRPVSALGNSTIGQHLRHTLEFFICLEQGFESGTINYDKRAHDKMIEQDRVVALNTLGRIETFVTHQHHDKPLVLEVGYDLHQEDFTSVSTNYARELIYNIEHAVHHMAIIKIGIREAAPYVQLAPDFGIAASTIRYQEAVAIHQ